MKKQQFPLLFPFRGLGSFWLVVWLALMLLACTKKKDPEPDLPPETATGAQTFGCMVNGVPFTPSPNLGLGPNPLAMPENSGCLTISASKKVEGTTKLQGVTMFSSHITSIGEYSLQNKHGISVRYNDQNNSSMTLYSTDSDVTSDGMLTITKFDIPNRIIAGRFWFTLTKTDGTTIKVTDGRFDCRAN
jgi:Family of unknown function (DUF6252)